MHWGFSSFSYPYEYFVNGSDNYSESCIHSFISESGNSSESANDLDGTHKYKHLWVLFEFFCESSYKKKF